MKLLFAAGDVGGARAILPVARCAVSRGWNVSALDGGVFRAEGDSDWRWLDYTSALLDRPDAVVYATSVSSPYAFHVAKSAQDRKIPILHVLDNWSNYANRLRLGETTLVPDCYAVMDERAQAEARADGVPAKILRVTGHPDLAYLATEAAQLGVTRNANKTLFVSEPAAADSAKGRGYDERSVASHFVQALSRAPDLLAVQEIYLAPHPRENRADLARYWHDLAQVCFDQTGLPLQWSLVAPQDVRHALHQAGHVVGMSSILLYEAWLLGTPVASLQPALIGSDLRTLSYRSGLNFCDQLSNLDDTVIRTLSQHVGAAQNDLTRHKDAAQHILDIIEEIAI